MTAAHAARINVHFLKRTVFEPNFFNANTEDTEVLANLQQRVSKIVEMCRAQHVSSNFFWSALGRASMPFAPRRTSYGGRT